MSEYTPTTEEIRGRHNANAMLDSRTWRMADAEFYRWFSSEIASAEARGYFKSVQDAYNNRMRLEEEQ